MGKLALFINPFLYHDTSENGEKNVFLQIFVATLRAHLRRRNAFTLQHVPYFLDILIDPKPDGGVVVMYL